jgi:hypothetical protein
MKKFETVFAAPASDLLISSEEKRAIARMIASMPAETKISPAKLQALRLFALADGWYNRR